MKNSSATVIRKITTPIARGKYFDKIPNPTIVKPGVRFRKVLRDNPRYTDYIELNYVMRRPAAMMIFVAPSRQFFANTILNSAFVASPTIMIILKISQS